MSAAVCETCPHRCRVEEGGLGFCGARANRNGKIVCDNYGMLTSLALDPVEKKPLHRFFPGSLVLSAGSYGCNLRCPFCQNHGISMARKENSGAVYVSPEELAEKALSLRESGNIGLAFTYNEPLISWEYVRDCCERNRNNGMKNIVVTNGYIQQEVLRKLLPLTDAMNIDLKAFSHSFYRELGGGLDEVLASIRTAAASCHVEVTTLIIPGKNDSPEEMRRLAQWLEGVGRNIPLHVTRFFPSWHMEAESPTPVETVYSLARVAREFLPYVYEGNC